MNHKIKKKEQLRQGELLFFQSNTHQLDINFDFCGKAHGINAASKKPAIKNCYVLHFVLLGEGYFNIHGETTEIAKDDCFLLPKNVLTSYWPKPEQQWEYIWIGISGTKIEEYLNRSQFRINNMIHCKEDSKFKQILLNLPKLLEENQLTSNEDLFINSQLYRMLYYLAIEFPFTEEKVTSPQKDYLLHAINYIHNFFDKEIRVETIAAELNISRIYLYKIFKQYLDISPQQYLMQIRLEKSCDLLEKTNYSISEIAYSVGYTDSLAFSKAFSKVYNQAPSKYRNKLKMSDKKFKE